MPLPPVGEGNVKETFLEVRMNSSVVDGEESMETDKDACSTPEREASRNRNKQSSSNEPTPNIVLKNKNVRTFNINADKY